MLDGYSNYQGYFKPKAKSFKSKLSKYLSLTIQQKSLKIRQTASLKLLNDPNSDLVVEIQKIELVNMAIPQAVPTKTPPKSQRLRKCRKKYAFWQRTSLMGCALKDIRNKQYKSLNSSRKMSFLSQRFGKHLMELSSGLDCLKKSKVLILAVNYFPYCITSMLLE